MGCGASSNTQQEPVKIIKQQNLLNSNNTSLQTNQINMKEKKEQQQPQVTENKNEIMEDNKSEVKEIKKTISQTQLKKIKSNTQIVDKNINDAAGKLKEQSSQSKKAFASQNQNNENQNQEISSESGSDDQLGTSHNKILKTELTDKQQQETDTKKSARVNHMTKSSKHKKTPSKTHKKNRSKLKTENDMSNQELSQNLNEIKEVKHKKKKKNVSSKKKDPMVNQLIRLYGV